MFRFFKKKKEKPAEVTQYKTKNAAGSFDGNQYVFELAIYTQWLFEDFKKSTKNYYKNKGLIDVALDTKNSLLIRSDDRKSSCKLQFATDNTKQKVDMVIINAPRPDYLNDFFEELVFEDVPLPKKPISKQGIERIVVDKAIGYGEDHFVVLVRQEKEWEKYHYVYYMGGTGKKVESIPCGELSFAKDIFEEYKKNLDKKVLKSHIEYDYDFLTGDAVVELVEVNKDDKFSYYTRAHFDNYSLENMIPHESKDKAEDHYYELVKATKRWN